MKKTFSLLVCALCASIVVAQDIIITKDAQRIEAKIQEVSNQEIKYKLFTYQDGPVFVLSIADINSITFENGDVQVYNPISSQAQQTQQEPVQEAETQAIQQQPVQVVAKQADEQMGAIGMIEKYDDYYYLRNGDSSTRMDKTAYLRFIQNNCPEAWQRYQQGNKLWKAGWGLLGAGIGVEMLIGVPLYCAGVVKSVNNAVYYDTYNSNDYTLMASGLAFIAIGSLMEAGSIPLLVVGGIKRNNTHEVYNVSCAKPNRVSLNLQSSSNGIGLALKF